MPVEVTIWKVDSLSVPYPSALRPGGQMPVGRGLTQERASCERLGRRFGSRPLGLCGSRAGHSRNLLCGEGS